MRIADNTSYLTFMRDLQRTQQQYLEAQMQVSSGMKVQKPSDDPAAASDIIRLSGEQAEDDQFGRNLSTTKSRLSAADVVLDGVETMVERARELGLTSLGNLTNTSATRAEIEGLREQLVTAANATHQGRYIFGGSVTTSKPFVKESDGSVTYEGNSNAVSLQVGRDITLQAQLPGEEVFGAAGDLFKTMSDLLSALSAGNHDDTAAQVKKLEQFSATVSTARSRIGGYINVADSLSSQISAAGLSRTKELNDVQAADMAQAITQLTLSQTNLQATLAVGAKIAQMSLLDYL